MIKWEIISRLIQTENNLISSALLEASEFKCFCACVSVCIRLKCNGGWGLTASAAWMMVGGCRVSAVSLTSGWGLWRSSVWLFETEAALKRATCCSLRGDFLQFPFPGLWVCACVCLCTFRIWGRSVHAVFPSLINPPDQGEPLSVG